MLKVGGLGVRGHPKSPALSPFDRAHTPSYSILIETMHVSYFNLPHLHLVLPLGVTPFVFTQTFGTRKLKSLWSCLCDPNFSHFVTVLACNRQTDRHSTHTLSRWWQHVPCQHSIVC